jgi:hypothetical protein
MHEALDQYFTLWLEQVYIERTKHPACYLSADLMRQAFLENLNENVILQFADCQEWEELFADLTERET